MVKKTKFTKTKKRYNICRILSLKIVLQEVLETQSMNVKFAKRKYFSMLYQNMKAKFQKTSKTLSVKALNSWTQNL